MSDQLDDAQKLEELDRAKGVQAVAAALAGPGAAQCEHCGDEIPAARRAAFPAAIRCIDCQERAEWVRRTSRPLPDKVQIFRGRK